MPDSFSRDSVSNHILKRLSAGDFTLLEPHLQAMDLPVRTTLVRDKKINNIYFMESGFASVVANGLHKPSIEVGIIGREGMTGVSVILGGDRPANETFIQAAGSGLCISAAELRRAIDQSVSLHRSLLRFANSFLTQTTQTALANGRSKIEERLSRWLLMADDRIDGAELPLTHEFLSIMLGVQRSGVTIALQALERDGLISTRRSKITIIDRNALEKNANGTYSPAKRLMVGSTRLRTVTVTALPFSAARSPTPPIQAPWPLDPTAADCAPNLMWAGSTDRRERPIRLAGARSHPDHQRRSSC